MHTDAVIGCDSVETGAEAVRLKTATGEDRAIRWDTIKFAGTGHRLEAHVAIKAIAEKVAPLLATHDSLWVVYGDDGFARLMLEKTNPKRGAILDAFEAHLGDRWRGDALTESDLTGALLIPAKVQMPKSVVFVMALVGVAFFLAIAILYFVHGAKPTSP
jgi:hypothetical protein